MMGKGQRVEVFAWFQFPSWYNTPAASPLVNRGEAAGVL